MASQSKDALQHSQPGWEFSETTFGATAPCDRIDAWYADTLSAVQPDFVVLSFLGNNITSCTGYATGPSLLERYRRDVTSLCHLAVPANCVLVGQPPLMPSSNLNLPPGEPTTAYVDIVAHNTWLFVDAGAAVEDANGGYVPSLRSGDTLHFSPEGAARYGYAIGEFLTNITR